MTKQAYKNGFEAGAKKLAERLKQGRASDLIVIHIDALDKHIEEMVGEQYGKTNFNNKKV
jgi:hypothetical protein